MAYEDNERNNPARPVCNKQICGGSVYAAVQQLEINAFCTLDVLTVVEAVCLKNKIREQVCAEQFYEYDERFDIIDDCILPKVF